MSDDLDYIKKQVAELNEGRRTELDIIKLNAMLKTLGGWGNDPQATKHAIFGPKGGLGIMATAQKVINLVEKIRNEGQ